MKWDFKKLQNPKAGAIGRYENRYDDVLSGPPGGRFLPEGGTAMVLWSCQNLYEYDDRYDDRYETFIGTVMVWSC